jgi:hypothetical protein
MNKNRMMATLKEEEECWKLIARTLSLEIEIRTPW